MNDKVKFSTTYNEINSEYTASYEHTEEMQAQMSSEDESFDTAYQEVVPTGKETVSDEHIEELIAGYFEKNPIQAVSKYPDLKEKPKINGVELNGNKTAKDLKLQPEGNYLTEHQSLKGYATEKWVEDKKYLTEHQDLSDYALKKDLPEVPKKVSAFQNDAGYLTEHQPLDDYAKKSEIPDVPEWSMQETKPAYTPEEVGADVSGAAAQALSDANIHTGQEISKHNVSTDAHNDIRIFIAELSERVNALADSDDTTLDQMSEIVAYIKNNRELVEQVTTEKVSVSDIIDNLTTNLSNKVLSASMGVYLKQLIDDIVIPTKVSVFENDKGYLTEHQDVSGKLDSDKLLDLIYPVGSIYMSTNNTSPQTFLGGRWEQIKDRFLLSSGDTYSAGSTGGEATHTLTIDEMPKHGHTIRNREGTGPNGICATTATSGSDGNSWCFKDQPFDLSANSSGNFGAAETGGGKAHNNMPPYLAVYIWKRTA